VCRCVNTYLDNPPLTFCFEQSQLPEGSTVAPVIIATDKTHLTQFSGNKCAYPVYLTIGNLPKEVRRKPSEQGCILIGYLSVDKVRREGISKVEQRSRMQRLFHDSMRIIMKPLKAAGLKGVEMNCGDGSVRRVHPILACYVADYPEQCLVTCAKYGTCPKCLRDAKDMQEFTPSDPRTPEFTIHSITTAAEEATSASDFKNICYSNNVSAGTQRPFWQGFPYTDIHMSTTPDVLHQLYQGVLHYLITWCQEAMSEKELDRRIRCLPPSFGVRHFKNGISALTQISGGERKEMAKILLGCLVGVVPIRGLRACRGILDFIYMARYPSHDEITLGYMQDALNVWKDNRSFFISIGIRDDFNIPKFHSLLHYIDTIRLFGTTDNYNSELFERLHIDFAKEGWRASNNRNELPQMIKWLERQEKVSAFQSYINMRTRHGVQEGHCLKNASGLSITIPKHPSIRQLPVELISKNHHCAAFQRSLKEYLSSLSPNPVALRSAKNYNLPFQRLDIFHGFKFAPVSVHDDDIERDAVKASPEIEDNDPRFDTVVAVDHSDPSSDTAESTGLEGENFIWMLY
jgi:hypothetical protein